MKIAMLTNNYKPFIGGVPISIERLAEGLRNLGHQVTVFAPEGAGCKEEPGVVRYRVLYEQRDKGLVIGNFIDKRIEKEFRDGQFDVIHVHHPVVIGFTAVYLSKKYGIPLAYTYHTRYEEYLHYFKLYERMTAGREPVRNAARFSREVLVPKYLTAFADQCDTVFVPTASMKECLVEQGVAAPMEVLTARKRSVPGIWTEKNGCLLRLHAWKRRKISISCCGEPPVSGTWWGTASEFL